MKFVDEAKIYIKSGDGGNGCMSFRRAANEPMGGPDGGNGGKGGNIIFRSTKSINTLLDYRYQRHFKAKNGQPGKGRDCSGKKGEDLVLKVPVGTQILTESGKIIADLDQDEQEIILLKGGIGGHGNAHFKTSRRQAPKIFEKGELGEELNVILELKVISDLGIIGFPNAGKSTLLSVISRAKPKIANYPFTTIRPQLGVVYVHHEEFVMADIPGLIEGASEGVGLGYKFLRHIERCKALVHLIDISSDDILKSYKNIRHELEKYSQKLAQKKELIVLNKVDLLEEKEVEKIVKKLKKSLKLDVIVISAVTQENIEELKSEMLKLVKEADD